MITRLFIIVTIKGKGKAGEILYASGILEVEPLLATNPAIELLSSGIEKVV